MSTGLAAMLAGAFVVPAVLLWAGHRLRRRTPRWRAGFWGALLGHLVAMPLALAAALWPPRAWEATDAWRGALGWWGLVALPVLGALAGLVSRAVTRDRS